MKTTCTLMAAAALAVAGCDTGGGEPAETEPESSSVSTEREVPDTVPDGEPAAAEPGPALARRDGQINDEPVTLEIAELRRSGGTVALSFRLSMPAGPAEGDTGPDIEDTFDDGVGQYDAARGNDENSVDGVSLIDSKNRKRHLVGRDATGTCVCDGNLYVESVSPGSPMVLSATFAAPPPDVEAMDVVIPRYGTFKDVPVQ